MCSLCKPKIYIFSTARSITCNTSDWFPLESQVTLYVPSVAWLILWIFTTSMFDSSSHLQFHMCTSQDILQAVSKRSPFYTIWHMPACAVTSLDSYKSRPTYQGVKLRVNNLNNLTLTLNKSNSISHSQLPSGYLIIYSPYTTPPIFGG